MKPPALYISTVSAVLQSSKSAPNIVSDWGATKAATEQTMKLMQMYKDLGDFEGQVLTLATTGSSSSRLTAVGRTASCGSYSLQQSLLQQEQ
jgi:hypothetical protein